MKGKLAVLIAFVVGIADIAFFGQKFHVYGVAMNHSQGSQIQSIVNSKENTIAETARASSGDGKSEISLDVAAESQQPELYNGCEMTSLSMLLDAVGHPVDKMQLADQIAKDPSPEVTDDAGNIISWGDPENGFVGDITGKDPGYGVYHKPVVKLLDSIMPGKALDLTGSPFSRILQQLAQGKPVVAWTTVNFTPTTSWVTWKGPNGPVRATFDEHVVLIVGFNDTQIFVNDPLDGSSAKAVDRASFEASWNQLGSQAVTVK